MLAYKFRLHPNQEEERKMLWTKEVCRRAYNRFLELYTTKASTTGPSCMYCCRYGRRATPFYEACA